MGRVWITALCFAVIAWIAYNMLMDGWDISGALLAMLIVGALLVLELVEKQQKNKTKPLYVMSDMQWETALGGTDTLAFAVDVLADGDMGNTLERWNPDIDYVA